MCVSSEWDGMLQDDFELTRYNVTFKRDLLWLLCRIYRRGQEGKLRRQETMARIQRDGVVQSRVLEVRRA